MTANTGTLYEKRNTYYHTAVSGTAVLHTNSCFLERVTVNTGASNTRITVYDSPIAAGTVLAVVDCTNPEVFDYHLTTISGLSVFLNGTADVTVVYQ